MIFMWSNASSLEEEEEEEEGGALNDALLDELVDEDAPVDELVDGEVPLVVVPPVDLDADEGEDETAKAFFEDEVLGEDEEVDADYDSFDDKDDL
jgi:hypothetical protein